MKGTAVEPLTRLNAASLEVGDIVLTTTTALVSKAIQFFTRSDISHAMVYVADHSVIDARGEGVHARNTKRLFFSKDCPVYVLRLRDGLLEDKRLAVVNFMRQQIGVQYTKVEAAKTAMGGGYRSSRKQFCSRLVAQAFASVNIKLVDNANFCSPDDLKKSPQLIIVQDSTLLVSAHEAAAWKGCEDVTDMMRHSTNEFLEGARQKDKNIQNFDDVNRHLFNNPHDDDYFCELADQSGYLSVWRKEVENNPWAYDIDLAISANMAGLEEYCWSILSEEAEGPNRFAVNRGGYISLSRQTNLRFFAIMTELYECLASLHNKRVEVASRWLEANGLHVAIHPQLLKPHSSEWFSALNIWDSAQAAQTRQMILLAGSIDVCSICGDDDARDYQLPEKHRPTKGVGTLRLCDDCLKLRRGNSEPFIPFSGNPGD